MSISPPPGLSMRQQIIAALKARAAEITTANGFQTDAGLSVHYGYRRPATGDAMPRIGLVSGELQPPDPINQGQVIVRIAWPVWFIGIDRVELGEDDVLDKAEAILSDLKRAIFLPDRTLNGVLLPNSSVGNIEYGGETVVDREDGGHYVQCALCALVTWVEGYGVPTGPE